MIALIICYLFFRKNSVENVWLGLVRYNKTSPWRWNDGTAYDYTSIQLGVFALNTIFQYEYGKNFYFLK